ncbi:Non-reducing polyketide synthase andM [Paramyrothecium foliicola]|nr:Non-reducing polyketide synthase andM [Paramyrothecium foliicola]
MASHNGQNLDKRILLIGPQISRWKPDQLRCLQNSVRDNSRLIFLAQALATLPDLTALLQPLSDVDDGASRRWQALSRFAQYAEELDAESLTNCQLAPLTVVSQVIEWFSRRKGQNVWLTNDNQPFIAVQGLCIGFFLAAILATARNEEEFRRMATTSVRLAACIGAILDYDNQNDKIHGPATALVVRCKTASDRQNLDVCLDSHPGAYTSCVNDIDTLTVTVPSQKLEALISRLENVNIKTTTLAINGYYHHPKHQRAADILKALSKQHKSISLADARPSQLQLRLTSDARLLETGNLHDAAIESILCRKTHWYQTIKNAIADFGIQDLKFESVGRFDKHLLAREERLNSAWGGFIDNYDKFDHRFFNISGREAKNMDPQQRLVLQVTYEALEVAGYSGTPEGQRESNIGCYLGVSSVDYDSNIAAEAANAFSATGSLRAFISGRVSHFFGWSGPSITFDTACSSSAVAIHTACKALLSGECSMAVAGGVNVITSPFLYQNLSAASLLNSHGPSRAFDAAASGYCRGEGAGIVVLKPLSRALADKDDVLGVISSSAVSQNPNTTSITVPNSAAQSTLFKKVLSQARINADDITYVEAHGTGTLVGDPIEYESIKLALSSHSRSQDLFLGSVKDNIGHTEAASGVAGLIKTVLMIQNRTVPKQANFSVLNPTIANSPSDRIIIPQASQNWSARRGLAALVNNYGAAGSNVSLVVRENLSPTPTPKAEEKFVNPVYPIVLSARSTASLQKYITKLRRYVQTTRASLADISLELNLRQNSAFKHRATFKGSEATQLSDVLRNFKAESQSLSTSPNEKPPVVFMFGGQTGNTVALSKEIYDNCQRLRFHINMCDSVCQDLGLPSIFPTIFEDKPIEDILQLHCMLLSLQISCAKAWLDSGLPVDTLIGHSFGQISALCVAESIDLRDAFIFVSGRARLIRDSWGPELGAMVSIEAALEDVEQMIHSISAIAHCRVEIACYNGHKSFVVAGSITSINQVERYISKHDQSFKSSRLQNHHAYHSHLTESILEEIKALANTVTIRPPRIRVETCSPHTSWENFSSEELAMHTRQPVYFSSAIERIKCRIPSAIWIEAGSNTPVVSMSRRVLSKEDRGNKFIPLNLSSGLAFTDLATATCELWMAGFDYHSWHSRSPTQSSVKLELPVYQFEQATHWLELRPHVPSKPAASSPISDAVVSLISRERATGELHFLVNTSHAFYERGIKGHVVAGHELLPASLYLALTELCVILVSSEDCPKTAVPNFTNVAFLVPLTSKNKSNVYISLRKAGRDAYNFVIYSANLHTDNEHSGKRIDHGKGDIKLSRENESTNQASWNLLQRTAGKLPPFWTGDAQPAISVHGDHIYQLFSSVVEYASYYRGVRAISCRDYEAVGVVSIPPNERFPGISDHIAIDPVTIDNFLQVAGIHLNCLSKRKDGEVLVCTGIEEIILGPAHNVEPKDRADGWTVHPRHEVLANKSVKSDIFICNSSTSKLLVIIAGATFLSVPMKVLARTADRLSSASEKSSMTKTLTPHNVNRAREAQLDSKALSPINGELPVAEGSIGIKTTPQRTPRSNVDATVPRLRQLLSSLIEIPMSDITPSTTLVDIGIDSLLTTEIIDDISRTFGTILSQDQILGCADVTALSRLIQPNNEDSPEISVTGIGQNGPDVSKKLQSNSAHASLPCEDIQISAIASECFSRTSSLFDHYSDETMLSRFYNNCFPVQSKLVLLYIVEAYAKLGCDLRILKPGDALPGFTYHERHDKLIAQIYQILKGSGIISRTVDGVYQRTSSLIPTDCSDVLSAEMMQRFPQHAAETKLLHSTGSRLADCLSGTMDPLSILFQDSAARNLLYEFYADAPMFKTGSKVLVGFLQSVFHKFKGSARKIRILEIGAGTGGTTGPLVDMLTSLAREGIEASYTFSDISPSLVASARRKFSEYPFMEYMVLNIEEEPGKKMESLFDIVISTNCIHATSNLVQSTRNIHRLLRPDGLVCLVELTRNLYWFDLVFGLLEGWWLYKDERNHALAHEEVWRECLQKAGYEWVDWIDSPHEESKLLRLIVASPKGRAAPVSRQVRDGNAVRPKSVHHQTCIYKSVDGMDFLADVFFPCGSMIREKPLPVALMIHGGGHIMLSRRDINPAAINALLNNGFLPISIDYRLCPEVTLSEGPMKDVVDALSWIRNVLPTIHFNRDISIDANRVVAVGWSTGGHLAMSLGWTTIPQGIRPPDAIVGFYCPSDYEDSFWTNPNYPEGVKEGMSFDLAEIIHAQGVKSSPITAYNIETSEQMSGSWLSISDARSRLALYMNTTGRTLHVLINGLRTDSDQEPPRPTVQEIAAVSPLAQIRQANYRTPTFLIHPRLDDLIPWQQAQRTYEALRDQSIDAELRIIEDLPHLFDVSAGFSTNEAAQKAVQEAFDFLARHAANAEPSTP